MGIRGLAGYLKWKTPYLRRELQWANHYGETWGIDCSCILYRAQAAGLSPLTVLAKLILQMKQVAITPIVIFDGRPPSTKDTIIEQRRIQRNIAQDKINILTSEMNTASMPKIQRAFLEKKMMGLRSQNLQISSTIKNDVKQFLYGAGVLFMTACGEADDVLAYLSREKTIQAVVSTDMDMFPRGVNVLIIPETRDASILGEIHTSDILESLNLTYSQFVDACVIMGSDYTDKSLATPEYAFEIVRNMEHHYTNKATRSQLIHGARMLRGDGQTWDTIFSDTQQHKWMIGAPQPEPDTLKTLCHQNGWPVEWVSILSSVNSLIV